MGNAIGYIRRSRVFSDRPGTVSHEAQTTSVRELAERHGFKNVRILEDWGRSGGAGKEAKRTAYLELRAALKSGAVTDVFAYDQSRLTRSTVEWASLVAICREKHVRVHLVNGGTKDFDSVDGRMTADILATVAQAERERGVERGLLTIDKRNRRGDKLGPPRYGWRADGRKDHEGEMVRADGEDVGAVVDLFRQTGSYTATARELNSRGVPNKRAGRLDPRTGKTSIWRALAVHRVIQREAPELVPANPRPGARMRQPYRLAGLLRCACGATLTPFRHYGRNPAHAVSYRCQRSYTEAGHPRPSSVPEHVLAPWILDQLGRYSREPARIVEAAVTERAEIMAERARLALGHARGALDEATYLREDETLLDRLEELPEVSTIVPLGPLDDLWTEADPADANIAFRNLWSAIVLGPDMRPVRAERRSPALWND